MGIAVKARGAKKSAQFNDLVGCSNAHLITHIEKQFSSGMTWGNYGFRGWHIDHKIPCSKFNLTDPLHQRACFHYTNLQPLWAADNFKKGNRVMPPPQETGVTKEELAGFDRERLEIEKRLGSEAWKRIDAIEAAIAEMPQASLPLNHTFAGGIYLREIFLPAGTLLTSRIHLQEHPYLVTQGVVSVWSEEDGSVTIHAHHSGVTKPGTRRILYAHTDVIWVTAHLNPTNETDPDEIVRRVTWSEGKFQELGASRS